MGTGQASGRVQSLTLGTISFSAIWGEGPVRESYLVWRIIKMWPEAQPQIRKRFAGDRQILKTSSTQKSPTATVPNAAAMLSALFLAAYGQITFGLQLTTEVEQTMDATLIFTAIPTRT